MEDGQCEVDTARSFDWMGDVAATVPDDDDDDCPTRHQLHSKSARNPVDGGGRSCPGLVGDLVGSRATEVGVFYFGHRQMVSSCWFPGSRLTESFDVVLGSCP